MRIADDTAFVSRTFARALLVAAVGGPLASAQVAPPAALPVGGNVVQAGAWAVPLGAPVAVAQTPAPENLDLQPDAAAPALDPAFAPPASATDPTFLAPENVISEPGMVDPYFHSAPAGADYGPSTYGGSTFAPPSGQCDNCFGSDSFSAAYGPTVAPQTVYQGFAAGRRAGLTAGFAFLFLRPRFADNNAFILDDSSGGGTIRTTNGELDNDLNFGYRIWLETVGVNDFGYRITYFDFDEPTDTAVAAVSGTTVATLPNFPTATGSLTSTAAGADQIEAIGRLDIYALDVEAVQRMRLQRWLFKFGGGLRHAAFEQDYRANFTNAGTSVATAAASRRFDGIGPTVFSEVRRPVGMSGLSLLAAVRGSLLYGEHKDQFNTSGTLDDQVAVIHNDDLIPVGEIQLGGEWSFWLTQCSVFSVQLAWESQVWSGAGNNAQRAGDLGLSGFNLALGLEW